MTLDEAKDVLIETCQTPFLMDVAEITRGLERWGYRVREYEILTDPKDVGVLQEYMVWVECSYGIELARRNVIVWLEELKDWPWRGHWHFVTYYHKPNQPSAEFTWSVCRFTTYATVRNTDAKPTWTDRRQLRSGQPPGEILKPCLRL